MKRASFRPLVWIGGGLLGLSLSLLLAWLVLGRQPRPVDLDRGLPDAAYSSSIELTGRANGSKFAFATIDGAQLSATGVREDGRFSLSLPLTTLGPHAVRVFTYNLDQEKPDAVTEGLITRTDAAPPAPTLIAVKSTGTTDEYQLLVAMPPGTMPEVDGGRLVTAETPADLRAINTDRVELTVVAATGISVNVFARGDAVSAAAGPFDLAALAKQNIIKAALQDTDTTVAYTVDRSGVSRMTTIVLGPSRTELRDLIEGRLDVHRFADGVVGSQFVGPGQSCGSVTHQAAERVAIVLGEQGTVTLEEHFPGLLRAFNTWSDRMDLPLCFPAGLPRFGNEGRLTVTVLTADFGVESTMPQYELAVPGKSASGADQMTYTWAALAPHESVVVRLRRDVQSWLAAFPSLRLGEFLPDPIAGSAFTTFAFGLLQSLGILLLLWVSATKHSRTHLPEGPRIAISKLLTAATAIALLPIASRLAELWRFTVGDPGAYAQWLVDGARVIGLDQGRLGVVVIGLVITVVSVWLTWFLIRRGFGYPALVVNAIGLAISGYLAIIVMSSIVLTVAEWAGWDVLRGERIALVAITATTVALVLWYVRRQLRILTKRPPQTASKRVRDAAWIATIALLLSLPFGEVPFKPGPWNGANDQVLHAWEQFTLMVVSAVGLVAVFAMTVFVRAAFGRITWESLADRSLRPANAPTDDPTPVVVRIAGRDAGLELAFMRIGLVLFMGYVIGTAGVFATLPLPLIIAFVTFGLVVVQPRAARRLARLSFVIRRNRPMLVKAVLRPADKPKTDAPGEPSAGVAADVAAAAVRVNDAAVAFVESSSRKPTVTPGEADPASEALTAARAASSAAASAIAAWRATAAVRPDGSQEPRGAHAGKAGSSPPPTHGEAKRRVAEIGFRRPVPSAAFAVRAGAIIVVGPVVLYLLQDPFGSLSRFDPYFIQRLTLSTIAFVGSWLVIAYFFGLMFDYLVGTSGLQKGIRLGLFILVLTVPFQLVGALGGQLDVRAIGLRTLQVVAFTTLLGAAFDLRLIRSAGLLKWSQPKQVVSDLGALAGAPQLTVALTFVTTAAIATIGTLATGQVTGLITRALSPFLPLPPTN